MTEKEMTYKEALELVHKYRMAVAEILHIQFIGVGAPVKTIAQYSHIVDNTLINVEGLAFWKN